ncbi:MAG: hypothetical protein JW889_13515 [Verrucomicrobia bacterium]|nr:hypothetical protein [Verrucomicrobiota bacterium]
MADVERKAKIAPDSVRFAYSPVWRALAFFVPVAIFAFAIRGLIQKPQRGDPEKDILVISALVCAFVALGPHLFIAAMLSGSFRVGDEGVSRIRLGRRHTLPWTKILEVRDFLNQIQVIPARESDTIYVQFYHNLVRPVTFHKTLIEHARKFEVNLMLRPTTRRFLPIRWRQLVLLGLIIGTGLMLLAVRLALARVHAGVMVVGLLAGCTYTTLSAALWMTVSKSHKRIRAQAIVFIALYFFVMLMPLMVILLRAGREVVENPFIAIAAYLFGYFSGSGLVGLFYPNRALEPKDHAAEVLGNQG